MDAIDWLVNNSSLYKEEGISVDENWVKTHRQEEAHETTNCEQIEEGDSDEWEEDNDNNNCGSLDSLLQPEDVLQEGRNILSVAPAEGNSPLSIFIDKNAESFLLFPSLYCGQPLKSPSDYCVKVHYSDLCKSELRRSDRRVAAHIPNIFFKLKKLK
eukprot:GHVU01014710.1.p1 GENE.GHVU01014710.1~~GHVU01014710.1.p1  ORF type:complete len:157 (+),score=27.23 GHVU01014710.1:167-637(+)